MVYSFLRIIFTALLIIFFAIPFLSSKVSANGITATVKLGLCGDGVVDTSEQCDGSNLGGASCTSRGFTGGTLSCDPSCEFDTSACTSAPPPPPSAPSSNNSGGGGGGGGFVSTTNPTTTGATVTFDGYAYPSERVTILRDGARAAEVPASPDAKFSVSVNGLSPGTYTFSVYAIDSNGLRSVVHTYTETITANVATGISGIIIPPTISIDKSEVKQGDAVTASGHALPSGTVDIAVHSVNETYATTTANIQGEWRSLIDTSTLENGSHSVVAHSHSSDFLSAASDYVYFTVGTKNIIAAVTKCSTKGDVNTDCKVNLIDFSILAYWFKRPLTPAAALLVDLNHDGKVELIDFSIMAYNWTG